jgi:hypothetical protein
VSEFTTWWRDSEPKQYDWAGGPKKVQFYFRLRAGFNEHGRTSLLLDQDLADSLDSYGKSERDSEPVEVVRAIVRGLERYLYSGQLDEAKRLSSFLEKTASLDYVEALRHQIGRDEEALSRLKERLRLATDDLASANSATVSS